MILRHCGKEDHITRLVLAACRHTLCHYIMEASSFQQLQVYVKHFHSPWQESLLALYSSSCYPLSQVAVSHNYRKENIISRLAFLEQPKRISVAFTPPPNPFPAGHRVPLTPGSSPGLPVQLWVQHHDNNRAVNNPSQEQTGSKLKLTLGTHLGHVK